MGEHGQRFGAFERMAESELFRGAHSRNCERMGLFGPSNNLLALPILLFGYNTPLFVAVSFWKRSRFGG